MEDLDLQFCAAYGEALFFAHLIEDIITTHLYECSYFGVNGYPKRSASYFRELTFETRIVELHTVYRAQQDPPVDKLTDALDLLRKIRNQLTHAFVDNVGSEFKAEEGIDQVIALLKEVALWERAYHKVLSDTHGKLLRTAFTQRLSEVLQRKDRPFDARVARSKISRYLGELKSLQGFENKS